jgi:hypothetical protein
MIDYIPEKFQGTARKLKRYLQRLLKYSGMAAADNETRADIVSDGPMLSESCALELEQAAKVPLPGYAEDHYTSDDKSQKQRLLDLLLTYSILFYKDETTAALNDIRLTGVMFTGLSKLYHAMNGGSTSLSAQLMEEFLLRAILRAENGEGVILLKTFQQQLRYQKLREPEWVENDAKHRRILFNCCDVLAREDIALQIPSQVTHTNSSKHHKRTEFVNSVSQARDEDEDLQAFAAMTLVTPPVAQSGAQMFQPRTHNGGFMKGNGRDTRDNKRDVGRDGRMENDRATREAKWKKIFNMAPCACCGASDHAMLSPNRDAAGQAIQCEYICPATQYSTWEEGRHAQPPFMKFTANASKFAKMCDNDASRAHEALRKYMEHGSGQYKNQQDRSTFKSAVLMACKAPQSVEAYPRHVRVMDAKREERCESCMIEDVSYDGDGNRVNELSIEYDSTDIEVGGDQGIIVAIGNHVIGLSGETG